MKKFYVILLLISCFNLVCTANIIHNRNMCTNGKNNRIQSLITLETSLIEVRKNLSPSEDKITVKVIFKNESQQFIYIGYLQFKPLELCFPFSVIITNNEGVSEQIPFLPEVWDFPPPHLVMIGLKPSNRHEANFNFLVPSKKQYDIKIIYSVSARDMFMLKGFKDFCSDRDREIFLDKDIDKKIWKGWTESNAIRID